MRYILPLQCANRFGKNSIIPPERLPRTRRSKRDSAMCHNERNSCKNQEAEIGTRDSYYPETF